MSEPTKPDYVTELKLWAVRAVAVIVLTLLAALAQRLLPPGAPPVVIEPPPPVTVVIEPPAGTPLPLDEFRVKLIVPAPPK